MNSATVRTLLVRGMLAGLIAGVFALVAASLLGEPQIDAAIAFEDAHTHEHGTEVVSRSLQSTAGLATGVLVYGVAIGGIASLAFSFALGRVGSFGPRATAALLAGAAFVAVYLVPFLKYPANPPGSSDGGSIVQRTDLYLLMLLFSVLVAVAATALGNTLAPWLGAWNATIAAVAAYVLVVAVGGALLPAVDETPADFPTAALYDFRLASLAVQAVLWAVLGLVFGALVERSGRRDEAVAVSPR
jgi:predicted cobalt transporter CbtA